jgi:hypothetical protein
MTHAQPQVSGIAEITLQGTITSVNGSQTSTNQNKEMQRVEEVKVEESKSVAINIPPIV